MRLRPGQQPPSPTLCLERLEDRRLLNGAVWWVMPQLGTGHSFEFKGAAEHGALTDEWSPTTRLVGTEMHGKTGLTFGSERATSNPPRLEIDQLIHITAEAPAADQASDQPGSGNPGHGKAQHASLDARSPTAQLVSAARQDEQKSPPAGKHEAPHAATSGLGQLLSDTSDDQGTKTGVGNEDQPENHLPPAASVAKPDAASAQDNDNSSSHGAGAGKSGSTQPTTGGSAGNHGNSPNNGSGNSQNNGKGGNTNKWWSHKGSNQSTGSPPPAHHGSADGSGSHSIPGVTKSERGSSSTDPGSGSDASQPTPAADATDSNDSPSDQNRGLALVLWDPDGSSARPPTTSPVGEGPGGTGGGEPRGAVVMVKLDDANDTGDGTRLAGHHTNVALANGDLQLKPQPAAQPAESSEPPALTAQAFEWLAAADNQTPATVVTVGAPEGCNSPAELLALGLEETQAAMKQLLAHLAQLGQEAAGALSGHGMGPWLVAAATGAVAAEMMRRRLRAQAQPILVSAAQASTSTWFPGLLD